MYVRACMGVRACVGLAWCPQSQQGRAATDVRSFAATHYHSKQVPVCYVYTRCVCVYV